MIFVMSNNNSELVRHLIEEGYLKTERIIGAFLSVDRKDFVPEEYKSESYGDYPLPIGYGQTISQPRYLPRIGSAIFWSREKKTSKNTLLEILIFYAPTRLMV